MPEISLLNSEEQKEYHRRLDDFAASASEALLGYREGGFSEMLARIKELVELEKQHYRQEGVALLFSKIRELLECAEDIEAGFAEE